RLTSRIYTLSLHDALPIFYYFHNCVYDHVWKNNRRRHAERFDTWDILRKYNPDYRLIFVGDATMSPYEVLQPGGSVEYNNEEARSEEHTSELQSRENLVCR